MYTLNDTSSNGDPKDGRKVDQPLAVVSGAGSSPGAAVQKLVDDANARSDITQGNYIVSLEVDEGLFDWQAIGLAVVVS